MDAEGHVDRLEALLLTRQHIQQELARLQRDLWMTEGQVRERTAMLEEAGKPLGALLAEQRDWRMRLERANGAPLGVAGTNGEG